MMRTILTDALSPYVLSVPHVAFAPVAGWRGNAAAVETQVGEVFAHVNGGLIQLA